MRTLSRPMFNMGGPIKQGIMNGIREPYAGGGAALVGNPVYPKTGGREHHVVNIPLMGGLAALRAAAPRLAPMAAKAFGRIKNLFGKRGPGTQKDVYGGYSEYGPVITRKVTQPGAWQPSWLGRDPVVRGVAGTAKGIYKGFTSPGAKTWAEKGFKLATAPSTIIGGVVWYLWPDGTKRKTPPPGNMIGAGPLHGAKDPTPSIPEPTVKSQAEKDAFAKSQREKRVNKYLDMMGYDRSKKLAIADALIDASKIVGERGTLDLKNITQELISPVIQATSKRLDKPQQIREAVGLMATKAEIEKDLSKETDALKTKALELQIQGAEQTLAESASFEGGLRKFISDRKGTVDKVTLERFARLLADEHGDAFTVIEDVTKIPAGGSGIYMSGSDIYRVTDGNAKQVA